MFSYYFVVSSFFSKEILKTVFLSASPLFFQMPSLDSGAPSPSFVLAVVFWFSWCGLYIRGTAEDSSSGKRKLSYGVPLERHRSPWMGA